MNGRKGYFSKVATMNAQHEAILQTLNREVDGCYFGAENFENVQDWAGVPIVYAPNHPEMDAFDTDPVKAVEAVKGKLLGAVKDASIDLTGHPKLKALLDMLDDPEVEEGIANGTISLSTAFWAKEIEDAQGRKLDGPIVPQHVLIFQEDRNNLPRDAGSGFLNKDAKNGNDTGENMDAKEMEEKVSSLEQELAARTAELQKAGEEVGRLNKMVSEFQNKEKLATWTALKNTAIMKGRVTEKDEPAMFELWDKDPHAFINKLAEWAPSLDSKEVGTEHPKTNKAGSAGVKVEDELAALGIPSLEIE